MEREKFLSKEEKSRIISNLIKIQEVAADFRTVLHHNYTSFITSKSEAVFYHNFNTEISELYHQVDRLIDGEGGES